MHQNLAKTISAIQNTRLNSLFAAVCLFFLIKLLFALLPFPAMGGPRLGDDAYVYLWRSESNLFTEHYHQRGVRDIASLWTELGDSEESHLEFARNRVAMRTTGQSPSLYMAAFGPLSAAGIDYKNLFALQEIITILFLSLALYAFFKSFHLENTRWIALPLLAVTVLPQQGLHFFIPSTLTFSLGLWLWAVLNKPGAKIWQILVLSVLPTLVHRIGLVHVGIGAIFVGTLWLAGKNDFRETAKRMSTVLTGWLLSTALIYGGINEPFTAQGMGAIRLDTYWANLSALKNDICSFADMQWPTLIIMAAALVAIFGSWRGISSRRALLSAVAAGILIAGVFWIDGYPGQLGTRLLAPIAILLIPVGVETISRLAKRQLPKLAAMLLYILAFAGSLIESTEVVEINLNARWPVIERAKLAQVFKALPDDSTLLYAEADFALMASFGAGASRFGAVPFPMIAERRDADKHIKAREPDYLVALPPKHLNGWSYFWAPTLRRRRYGFDFALYKWISLEGLNADKIYLRLRDLHPSDLTWRSVVDPVSSLHDCAPAFDKNSETAGDEVWYQFDLAGCATDADQKLQLSAADGWITGLSTTPPDNRLAWPWGSPVFVHGVPRGKFTAGDGPQALAMSFAWPFVLAHQNSDRVLQILDGSLEAYTDYGGLIIAKIQRY